jgi:hypothetical protein
VLGATHAVAPLLTFIRFTPRSRLLSAAGGVSVAYVVVHLLPEVAEAQAAVEESGILAAAERHAYVLALLGLVAFYGVERVAVISRRRGDATGTAAFWLGVGSFVLYNGIVGYLTVERARTSGAAEMVLYAIALGVHFVVNDLGLREHHHERYDRVGRPLLLGALAVGWLTGIAWEVSEAAVGLAIAFLAGGIMLNVLKEELPEERESRFGPFLLAAAAYAGVLLLV